MFLTPFEEFLNFSTCNERETMSNCYYVTDSIMNES